MMQHVLIKLRRVNCELKILTGLQSRKSFKQKRLTPTLLVIEEFILLRNNKNNITIRHFYIAAILPDYVFMHPKCYLLNLKILTLYCIYTANS